MALTNFLNFGQQQEQDDRDAFKPLESPFSLAPRVESPTVESPEAFFPGFGIDPFGKQIGVDPTQEDELSWWEQRQLDKDNERKNQTKAMEDDSLLSGVMAGDAASLNELARITGDLAEKASTASEFLTKKYLVDTYDISKDGASLLYDWYEMGGSATSTAKLIDSLPTPDWAVTIGDPSATGAVIVSDLPPLTSVEGEVIYNDDGTIRDIIFPDAPTPAQNPVSSFAASVEDAERRVIVEEDLNRRSQFGAVAEGVANIASVFASVEAYENDPNLGTGLGVVHTGASAVAFFTGNQTAASIASFTGPLYYFYLGTELIKALSYDQDYERDQANIGYKDGKFYTTGASRADYSYRGGSGPGSTWGESHADIASEYLNKYIDKYNLKVNEDVLNRYLEKNNYIGSNPYYNQLQSGRVGSGQEFFYRVIKSGALMITPETDPNYYMRSQQEILKDFQVTFNSMQNQIAEQGYRKALGGELGNSFLFTDKDRAERLAFELGTFEETGTDARGSYTQNKRYVVQEVKHDNGDVVGYRFNLDTTDKKYTNLVRGSAKIGTTVGVSKKTPDWDTRTQGSKLGTTREEYRSYKSLDFEKLFGFDPLDAPRTLTSGHSLNFEQQSIAILYNKYIDYKFDTEVDYYGGQPGFGGRFYPYPPMAIPSQAEKDAARKFMTPEDYQATFG